MADDEAPGAEAPGGCEDLGCEAGPGARDGPGAPGPGSAGGEAPGGGPPAPPWPYLSSQRLCSRREVRRSSSSAAREGIRRFRSS